MENLQFDDEEYDVIWSEGAICTSGGIWTETYGYEVSVLKYNVIFTLNNGFNFYLKNSVKSAVQKYKLCSNMNQSE